MKQYQTRKRQIEDDFFTAIISQCEADGVRLSRKARAVIKEELRSAAMVGACEERCRTLNRRAGNEGTGVRMTPR